jgi:hypothetical protein
MADEDRFGRSDRQYSGVKEDPTFRRGLQKLRRFGPSEKQYTRERYTPSGLGQSWGFTGDKRRKIPGYDVGSRPPRGLASLMSRQGPIGQDPRSTTYDDGWAFAFGSPDDLRGYRSSVADVAAANAKEERNRLNEKYRYAFTNPGSGVGIEEQYVGYPKGVADYLDIEEYGLGAVPKDPRDVGTLSEMEYDWPFGPWYRDTSRMGDYRRSWDPQMNEQTALNLKLLADLDRGGTDAYRFANTAPVSIGEREAFRSPANYQDLYDKFTETTEETPMRNDLMDSINRIVNQVGAQPGLNRGGIASLRYAR